RVLRGDVREIPEGGTEGASGTARRVLRNHKLQPQVRDSTAEWAPSWEGAGAATTRTQAAVGQAGDFAFGRSVGSGGLSLVGAAEGAAAELDALDPQTLPAECAAGAATAGHAPPADGPRAAKA